MHILKLSSLTSVMLTMLLALSLSVSAHAGGDIALETWRKEAASVRILAENDAPAAYQKAQTLQSILPEEATPSDRVRTFNLLARIESYLALTDAAEKHIEQAYVLAKKHADKLGQAEATLITVLNAINQGKLDVMKAAVIESIELLDGLERPDLISEAMLRAAMMYQREKQIEGAISTSLQSMEIAKESNNPIALAYAHHGLAITYRLNQQSDKAVHHYIKMQEQAHTAGLLRLEANAILGRGSITEDLVNGERLIRQATAMYEKIGIPYSTAFCMMALADNLNRRGLTAEGITIIDNALNIYNEYPNNIALWWGLITRSKFAQSLNRMDVAMADSERAYAIAQNLGFPIYIEQSAKLMGSLFAARGDHERAFDFLSEANDMSAKNAREAVSARISELTERYQSESKKRQLAALNLANERQAAELTQHKLRQRWLITLAASSMVVMFLTLPLLLHVRRANHMLKEEVAERIRIDEALTISERQFRTLVENTNDHIARYDKHCHCIYANPSMVTDTAIPLEQLLNSKPMDIEYEEALQKVLATAKPAEYELAATFNHGRKAVMFIQITPEFDADGNVASVLTVGRDITEIDVYRKQIHSLAFFDPLTYLPNRALFNDRIHQAQADAKRYNHQFGLMMLDLDHFKEINDTLGHSVGDRVLLEISHRIQSPLRKNDTLARLGGDEFAILIPKIHSNLSLDIIATKILSAFKPPLILDGHELFISCSIGISIYPDDSIDIETLFRYTDLAMYYAKQQGRNNFQFYSADFAKRSAERMTIENDLRKALARDELELYYQPQVELATGNVVGTEALLRWNHSEKGLISPEKFIPVAEESGLIVDIGEWVLRSACQAAATWNANRPEPLCIAVNLSTRQFIRNNLVGTVKQILKETACEPRWIKLEITESLLLEDSAEITAMLETFNKMGHSISIDDFGTGYSALSYLNRFPVKQIKIDSSFVKDIPHNHDKTELVKVMISIAQVLDMELIAEGVETQEQADCLLANGCLIGQGYLFSKPIQHEAFESLIQHTLKAS